MGWSQAKRLGPAHGDALGLEDVHEGLDVVLGLPEHVQRPAFAALALEEVPLRLVVDHGRRDGLPRRDEGVLDDTDDDLLERIPLVEGVDDAARGRGPVDKNSPGLTVTLLGTLGRAARSRAAPAAPVSYTH